MRFSVLRRRVTGVSERMLSQTLQWLEGDGLVSRRSYPVVPPHTEYALTDLGREAAHRVAALADWIEENAPRMARTAAAAATRSMLRPRLRLCRSISTAALSPARSLPS